MVALLTSLDQLLEDPLSIGDPEAELIQDLKVPLGVRPLMDNGDWK